MLRGVVGVVRGELSALSDATCHLLFRALGVRNRLLLTGLPALENRSLCRLVEDWWLIAVTTELWLERMEEKTVELSPSDSSLGVSERVEA